MTKRNIIAKGALAAVAATMAFTAAAAVPSFASAQSYGGNGYYYDPCRRESTNRGTVGALLGGALGAAIGSNAAARNARTEGALLGGAVGAVAGAAVGNRSAACNNGGYQSRYYDNSSGYYGDNRYYGDERYYSGSRYYNDGRAYNNGRYYGGSYDDDYAYDRYGGRYPIAEGRVGADGCTLAKSPIYLPDGRTQKRFVRVCQDSSGRYQVVD